MDALKDFYDPNFDMREYFLVTDLPTIVYWLTVFLIPIGIVACIMCISQVRRSIYPKDIRRFFITVSTAVITYLTSHFLRLTLLNFRWGSLKVLLPIVTFIEFLTSGVVVFIISMFILNSSGAKKMKTPCITIFSGLLVINTALLIFSQFTNLYYSYPIMYLGDGLIYTNFVQSDYYFLSNIPSAAMMLLDAILLVIYRRSFDKKLLAALWLYVAVPVAAIILKSFFPDFPFIMWATVIVTTYLLMSILKTKSEEYEKQKAEFTRIDTELSMATRIQADMLPNTFPPFPDRKEFDIYASMDPAKEVGGDFYDFFMVDDNHLGMVMADVSGKGVPAALFIRSVLLSLRLRGVHRTPVVSPVGSVGASACGRGLHRRPAPHRKRTLFFGKFHGFRIE